MKKYCAELLSLLLFLAFFPGCGGRSGGDMDYSAVIQEGREAVREVMEETGAPSVSLALVNGQRIIWSEAFGTADREAGREATPQTIYGVCSVSKTIAAIAVMILVDQGDVALDEPLVTYLPEFSMPLDSRYRNITVRMLLDHSSGLPGYDPDQITWEPFPEYASRMLEGMIAQRLVYEPGSISTYNNDGFTMVENLVRAVTGESYPDFVRRRILEPLGMTSSQFQNLPLPEDSCARAYDGESPMPQYTFNVYASGGLFSTPEEFSHVAMMLLNQGEYGAVRLLSPESVAAMGEDQRLGTFDPVPCSESRFGLGWDTVAQPALGAAGVTGWQKTGDIPGIYGSNFVVLPEENLGVAVFGASGSASSMFSSAHAMKIANRILLRALVERGRLGEMPQPLSQEPLPLGTVPPEEKMIYPGTYASSYGLLRLSYGEGDTLTAHKFDGTDWVPAYENFSLRSDGWYAGEGDPVTALRLLSRDGRCYVALRQQGISPHYSFAALIGQRLEENILPLSSTWEERCSEMWLSVNKDLSVPFPDDMPGTKLSVVPGLESYLLGSKILGNMVPSSEERLDGKFLIVPDSVRGMQDAAMESWRGQEWLLLGSYLYRPLSGVPLLEEGLSEVSIGEEGFGEWFRLPSSGTLSLHASTFWAVYSGEAEKISSGTQSAALELSGEEETYLFLYGKPGSSFSLTLSAE